MTKRPISRVATNEAPARIAGVSGDAASFAAVARDAGSWFQKAKALRIAAELIYDRWQTTGMDLRGPAVNLDLHEIAIMLMGQSLENLLKGIILQRDHAAVGPKGLSFGVTSKAGHDLAQLAARAGVQLDEGGIELLGYCTEALVTFGRYPLPNGHEDMRGSRSKSEPALRHRLRSTYDRFARQLLELAWPSVVARLRAEQPPRTLCYEAYLEVCLLDPPAPVLDD
jgi:hypothetical protein